MIRDGAIQVCVSDTGPGMNAEETARVFDKFYCGQSVPPESRGAGLGLAISKGLIALHGGTMWVASVPGEGSRFYFEIPHSRYSQMSFQEDAERSSSA
jgi:two-component system OmpR family sensor kinase